MGKVEWKRQHTHTKTDEEREIKRWGEKDKNEEEEGETRRGRCPLIIISIVFICICILLLPKMQMPLSWNPTKEPRRHTAATHVCVRVCGNSPWPHVICHRPLFLPSKGLEAEEVPLTGPVWHLSAWWMEAGMDWWMDKLIERDTSNRKTVTPRGHAPFN